MLAQHLVAKEPLRSIRVVYGDVQNACRFEMFANGRDRLEHAEGGVAHCIHSLIARSAYPILSHRLERGWAVTYDQLM